MNEIKSLFYALSPVVRSFGNEWEFEAEKPEPDEEKMVFLHAQVINLVEAAYENGFLSEYELKLFTEEIGRRFC